jgi:hypothetical protein
LARQRLDRLTWLSYALLVTVGYGLLTRSLPLPSVPLDPAPALAFDQDRAFAQVARLATEFPNRVTGTPADDAAARWVGDELRALGFAVSEQPFRAYGIARATDWGEYDGVNVVGVHRGAVDEAIVFGAHRDVVPTTAQGADDNGSGTGTLLELARALTATPHHYTYVFVSFGAEEIGLAGAAHFADHWPDMARVRLMLNFDMLGWRDAVSTRVDHWTFLPLPATALLFSMVARAPDAIVPDRSKTWWRVAGAIDDPGSDSAVFALRGYPALFFDDGPGGSGAPHHCYHEACDTLNQVSADALGRAGRFAEEFVRRVDGGDLLAGSGAFLVQGGQYVPTWQVSAAGLAVALFAVAQLGLAYLAARVAGRRQPVDGGRQAIEAPDGGATVRTSMRPVEAGHRRARLGKLAGPAVYWLGAAGVAAAVALAAPLPGLGAAPTAPRVWAWLGLVLIGLPTLFVLRRRTGDARPAAERLAFTAALVASYVLAALVTNLLLAAVAALPHLLLSSRVRLRPTRGWRLTDLAIMAPGCLWSALALTAAAGVGLFGLLPAAVVAPSIGLAYLGAVAPIVAALGRGGRPPQPPNPEGSGAEAVD